MLYLSLVWTCLLHLIRGFSACWQFYNMLVHYYITLALLRIWMGVAFESCFFVLGFNVFEDCFTWEFSMSTKLTENFIFSTFPMPLENFMRLWTHCTDGARIVMHLVYMVSHFCYWIKSIKTVSAFLFPYHSFVIFKICFSIFCFSLGFLSLLLDINSLFLHLFSFLNSFAYFFNGFFSSVIMILSWYLCFFSSCLSSLLQPSQLRWAYRLFQYITVFLLLAWCVAGVLESARKSWEIFTLTLPAEQPISSFAVAFWLNRRTNLFK